MLLARLTMLLAPSVRYVPIVANTYSGPAEDDACYLFDTEDGTKYVCTSKPDELAFMLGLDEKDLIEGVKPDDKDLIECSETWSHTGTPQWACTVAKDSVAAAVAGGKLPKAGTIVDMEAIGWEERSWAKRDATDDGACFIVSDEEAPDPSKQWFFCSDPSEDDDMVCELVPEWMGTAPDGGHAVWMCSKAKP